jgi:nitroreductase
MLDVIRRRRSIREYSAEPVTDEQVKSMLEAAMAAPSAHARNPWHFIVVRDEATRRELAQATEWSGMAASAQVVFVVCGDEQLSEHWMMDCSAATQNLLLEVTDLGLGAVWVGLYPRRDREQMVQRLLGIPSHMRPLCIVPVGHPTQQRSPRTRYDPAKIHHERF